ALQRMLQRALLLTVRPYRRDRLLVEKVRQVLAEHLAQARNADDVAAHLGLSTRTLHRQLKEEGASLQQLKDSVRRERALALLHKTRKPIKQVATGPSNSTWYRATCAGVGMCNCVRASEMRESVNQHATPSALRSTDTMQNSRSSPRS
ncbi:MAG: AraC family transcriptional regulator, partial [Betaproteobacteria bacterium]|nr:AraC family transcriptional regulator [Betaproteobacteria bacterium]